MQRMAPQLLVLPRTAPVPPVLPDEPAHHAQPCRLPLPPELRIARPPRISRQQPRLVHGAPLAPFQRAPLLLRTRSRPAGGAPRRSPIERTAAAAARPHADRLRQVGAPVPKHGGHLQSVPGSDMAIRSASDKRRVYLDTGRVGADRARSHRSQLNRIEPGL